VCTKGGFDPSSVALAKSGKDKMAPRRLREARRHRNEGPGEDVRDNGVRGAKRPGEDAPPDGMSEAVGRAVAPCNRDGNRIDVTRRDGGDAEAVGSHREHPRSRSDIVKILTEDAALCETVERHEATFRPAMMGGSERAARIDCDPPPRRRQTCAVMRAVHDESTGADRMQRALTLRHPIARTDGIGRERRQVRAHEAGSFEPACAGRRIASGE